MEIDELSSAMLRETLGRQREVIKGLEAKLTDEISGAGRVLEGKDIEIKELTAKLKDTPVDSLEVSQWQDKITELRCNLNEADMLIGAQRKKIEGHEKHINDLEQDMAFQGSGSQDEGRAMSETEVLFLRQEVLFLRGVVDRLLPERK